MLPSYNSAIKFAEFLSRPLAEARASTLSATTVLLCCVVALNWLPMPGFLAAIMAAVSFFAILGIICSIIRLVVMGLHHLIDSKRARRAEEQQAEIRAARLAEQEALLPTLIADMSGLHRELTEMLVLETNKNGYVTAELFKPQRHNNHHDIDFMTYLTELELATCTRHPSYRNGLFRSTPKLDDLLRDQLLAEGYTPSK